VNLTLVVVLSSVVADVIGVFGLLVAERERSRGSAWWRGCCLGHSGYC
jgi:hypothetical protein